MIGMQYMICQQATNRFRLSELTKHYPRCPLTIISPSVALELKGYLSDSRFFFVFAL